MGFVLTSDVCIVLALTIGYHNTVVGFYQIGVKRVLDY